MAELQGLTSMGV